MGDNNLVESPGQGGLFSGVGPLGQYLLIDRHILHVSSLALFLFGQVAAEAFIDVSSPHAIDLPTFECAAFEARNLICVGAAGAWSVEYFFENPKVLLCILSHKPALSSDVQAIGTVREGDAALLKVGLHALLSDDQSFRDGDIVPPGFQPLFDTAS